MSFRESRRNSSILRRERILTVEASAPFSKAVDIETIKNQVVAELPLIIEGGNVSQSLPDDAIVFDGGDA